MTKLKGEINNSTIIVGEFNNSLSIMIRNRMTINKEI